MGGDWVVIGWWVIVVKCCVIHCWLLAGGWLVPGYVLAGGWLVVVWLLAARWLVVGRVDGEALPRCLAMRALLAVTTSWPALSAPHTISLASVTPPATSTTRSISSAPTIDETSSVISTPGTSWRSREGGEWRGEQMGEWW